MEDDRLDPLVRLFAVYEARVPKELRCTCPDLGVECPDQGCWYCVASEIVERGQLILDAKLVGWG